MKRAAIGLSLLALLLAYPACAAEKAAPTVSITSPEPGITLATDVVDVTAVYSAPKGEAVKLLELLVDGALVQSTTLDPAETRGTLTLTWEASGYLDGRHQVVVRVTDTKGRVAKAIIPVDLTRGSLDARPIRITHPSPGARVAGRVSVTVDVAEASAVKYVIFLVDNVFKAMSNIRPFTYHWDTSGYLNGLHRLQAKVYLADGSEARSATIEVRVDNPSGATPLKPSVALAPPKLSPSPAPARATESALPPPVHAQTATPFGQTLEVYKAEIGAPGTAPYVSPTGELIQPPTATLAGRAGTETRIDAVIVPEAAETLSASAPVEASVATPPPTPVANPVRRPAKSDLPAAPASEETAPAEGAQVTAPLQVAALPTPASALERTPAESLIPPAAALRAVESRDSLAAPAAVAAPPAPKPTAMPASVTPKPIAATAPAKPAAAAPAPKQLAMLPPKPAMTRPNEPKPKPAAQPEPSAASYLVQPGDCLIAIADKLGLTLTQLAQANGLRAPYVIRIGQRLVIPQTGVYVNGERLESDVPSLLAVDNGSHLVPLRAVVERVGGTVSWEPATRQAEAIAREHRITVTIGRAEAGVDGKRVTLSVAPTLVANRTLVPARFLGDALDLSVTHARGVTRIAAK